MGGSETRPYTAGGSLDVGGSQTRPYTAGTSLDVGGSQTRPYTAGTPLQDILGDAVLEIAILPNTARATSIIGVAREVAALTDRPLRQPAYDVVMDGPPLDGRVVITTDEPDLNPRFVALLIEGVQQIPSPYWMQYRLCLLYTSPSPRD